MPRVEMETPTRKPQVNMATPYGRKKEHSKSRRDLRSILVSDYQRVDSPDRFIPARGDPDNNDYSSNELLKSVRKKKPAGNKNDNLKTCLMEKTNVLPTQQRVLNFNNSTSRSSSAKRGYWDCYSLENTLNFKVAKRKIPPAANLILNAPEVVDDFYLNVLHWGSRGSIAVGLGETLYLFQPQTQYTKALSCFSDGSFPSAVRWNPGGCGLAVGTTASYLQIWDPEGSKLVSSIRGSQLSSRIGCLSWQPMSNDILAVGFQSGEIQLYDCRRSEPRPINQFHAHVMDVCGLEWSDSGQYLASGGNDNRVHIWNTYHSTPWKEPMVSFQEHKAAVKAVSWCPWRSNVIASGGGTADKTLHIWNTATGAISQTVETKSQISGIVWSNEYKEILTSHGYNENHLMIWDPETLQDPLATLYGHTSRILHLTVSPDGQEVASLAADETLRIWQSFTSNKSKCRKMLQYGGTPSKTGSVFERDLLMYGLG